MSSTTLRHSPFNGIVRVVLATLLFASIDAAGKYLMMKFSVPLVSTVRYGLNLVFLALLAGPFHGRALWTTRRTGLVMVRSLSLAGATFFAGLALQRMPVGETIAIIYLQGFGIMIAAGLLLKERVGLAGWLAAAAGFAGVLLIARPGGALPPMGVVFALACAAMSVIYILLSRALAASESTTAMMFHVAAVGLVVFGLMLIFDWRSFSYAPRDAALLVYISAASLAGHFLLTAAYRFAPASLLAPFNYLHIAFATLVGWLVYSHVPDGWAFIGMAMIAGGGIAVAIQAHITKKG